MEIIKIPLKDKRKILFSNFISFLTALPFINVNLSYVN